MKTENEQLTELWRQAFDAFKRAAGTTKVGDMSCSGFDRAIIIWEHFEKIIDEVAAMPNIRS